MRALEILQTGPLTTVQDLGRPGYAALGVSPSGAADRRAHRLATALVGNHPGAAALEITFGGLVVRARGELTVALAGARCEGAPHHAAFLLRDGEVLSLGPPISGVRTTLAVRGGIEVEPVLGSRCTDTLSDLGPARPGTGDLLPIGERWHEAVSTDVAAVAEPEVDTVALRLLPGPRRDWFDSATWRVLGSESYSVEAQSDRVGLRLSGPALQARHQDQLPSEGLLRGAIQVPPNGQPIIFLADHPVTGGYPVIGYVSDQDIDRCAQVRPGQPVRFVPA